MGQCKSHFQVCLVIKRKKKMKAICSEGRTWWVDSQALDVTPAQIL